MNYWPSGLIPIIYYTQIATATSQKNAILTESNDDILTENSQLLLTES